MDNATVAARLRDLIEARVQERYAHELAIKEIDLVVAMFRTELEALSPESEA